MHACFVYSYECVPEFKACNFDWLANSYWNYPKVDLTVALQLWNSIGSSYHWADKSFVQSLQHSLSVIWYPLSNPMLMFKEVSSFHHSHLYINQTQQTTSTFCISKILQNPVNLLPSEKWLYLYQQLLYVVLGLFVVQVWECERLEVFRLAVLVYSRKHTTATPVQTIYLKWVYMWHEKCIYPLTHKTSRVSIVAAKNNNNNNIHTNIAIEVDTIFGKNV